jgi:predicted dinucleotide-binding enzyme
MKIGILGTGEVGQALATGFIGLGHDVKMGGRESKNAKSDEWAKKFGARASTGTFADAAAFGEVVALATLWSGTENALKMAGAKTLAKKVVIDVTNPIVVEEGKSPRLALGTTDSGGEQVQRWLPGARVVKCFNTVGHAHFVKPSFPGGPPDMFLCGNDEAAKKTVADICKSFGWPTIDTGDITGARQLEEMCILWVGYGMRTNTWNHAFKLLRK